MPAPDHVLPAIQLALPAELTVWRTAAEPALTITYAFENPAWPPCPPTASSSADAGAGG